MIKKALVLLADGFEDVEAVTPIDYLRRAGIEVITVSISQSLTVTSRWGLIKLTADTTLASFIKNNTTLADAVIIPGGMPGAKNLSESNDVNKLITDMAAAGKLICAICASPAVVLSPLGLLSGKKFTCYPELEKNVSGGIWSSAPVVTDGNIITSRAAGTAGHFSIAIIEYLTDKTTAEKIAGLVLLKSA